MTITREQFAALFGLPDGIPGSKYLTHVERAMLVALARHVRAQTVIEFGIQDGTTALALLSNCPTITMYVGVDLPEGTIPHLQSQSSEVPSIPGELVLDNKSVEIIQKDSRLLTWKELPEADFIWIDGGHDEETVRHDTELALSVIGSGGCIAWHDYNSLPEMGIKAVIDRMIRSGDDRYTLVAGTWTVFRFCDFPNPYREDTLAVTQ